jgi:hypothetical protein
MIASCRTLATSGVFLATLFRLDLNCWGTETRSGLIGSDAMDVNKTVLGVLGCGTFHGTNFRGCSTDTVLRLSCHLNACLG